MKPSLNTGCRRAALWIGAALVASVLGSCSSDDEPSLKARRSTTTSSAPTTTTPTASDPQEAAVAAYQAFWRAFLAAADPVNPEDPRLADYATGKELATVRSSFLAIKSAGNVIRGTLDLTPRVVSADAGTVVVSDCYDDQTGLYSAETGARQDSDDLQRHLVTATVVLVDGAWKVSAIKNEGTGCTAS